MGKKRKHLSHEEIWDDSALVNSWNEALEEYKVRNSRCCIFFDLTISALSQYTREG